jgi:hypothetical protein
MTDGVNLGTATLGLEVGLAELRAGLDDALARVTAKVAEMQRVLDTLHASVDGGLLGGMGVPVQGGLGLWAAAQDAELASVRRSVEETDAAYVGMAVTADDAADIQVAASGRVVAAYAAQAAAAKATADAEEAAAGRSALARSILGGIGGHGGTAAAAADSSSIWGVRGPAGHPFSAQDPGVVVVEAASRTPLGSLAAAIGEDAQGGGPEAVSVSTERDNTRTVVGGTPIAEQARQRGSVPALIGLDAQRQQVMESSLAKALTALEAAQRPSSPSNVTTIAGITQEDKKVADATGSAIADALAAKAVTAKTDRNVLAEELRSAQRSYQGTFNRNTSNSPAALARIAAAEERLDAAREAWEAGKATHEEAEAAAELAAANLATRNLRPGQEAKGGATYRAAYEALGYTVASRAAGGPPRLYAPGGEPGTGNYGVTAEAAARAAAGSGAPGGSGGGGLPPWLAALLWGHAGGGGGGYSGAGTGLVGHAIFGAAGLGAGIGSLGSFAGFGPEHIVLTLGGIAGSGVAALGGGALLGAGALGKFAAGAGSDLAVSSSAVADTKTLYTEYEKLREAVAQYGKASTQAKEAQAELTATQKYNLSGTKGVEAELHLAEKVSQLNVNWDKETSEARVAFVKLIEPLVEIGEKWIPLVNHAADENFTQTAKYIKPFFEYLKGPEAMGIFLQLESEFKNEIPTAMQALDQGFQFFGKTVAYTAPLTGEFLTDLDRFFTKWNTPSEFAVWESEMNKLITDFDVWKAFIKELGGALVDLFDKDAHTGEGIIETLTEMLHKVREYEKSVAGGEAIHNIFTVHKAEAIALLEAIVPLIAAFSHIYTTVSPPLVEAVTDIAEAFTKVVTAVEKTGALGTWAIGLTLIAAKLGQLKPLLAAVKDELLGTAAAEDKNAAAAAADAGATAVLADSEAAVGAAGLGAAAGVSRSAGGVLLPAGVEGDAAAGGAAGLLTKSSLLKAGIYGVGGLLAGSLAASAVGAKGTLASSLGDAGAGAGVGFALGGPLGAVLGAGIGASAPYVVKAMGDLFSTGTERAVLHAQQVASRYSGLDTGLLGTSNPYTVKVAQALKAPSIVTAQEAAHFQHTSGASDAEIARLQAEAAPAYRKAGEVAGQEFVAGEQHVRFPSRLGFLVAMEQHLNELPAAARTSAAKTMLAYAEKLESEGRLPQGVIAGFVTALEHKVSGLTSFLGQEGLASAHALQKSYELTEARSTLKNSLVAVEQLFGVSFKDTTTGVEQALGLMNQIVKNNKGPMGQAAKEMAGALKNGLEVEWIAAKEANAREIASINKELNTEIKQLGGSEIQAGFGGHTGIGKPVQGKGINLGSEPTPFGKATGGLLQIGQPGDAGHDTVGLNVGGLPIAVGAGEQVAVFNRHQQPIVNAALEHMGYGGLPGLFGAVTTPNYMAAGGLIPDVVQAGLKDVRSAAHAHVASISRPHGTAGGRSSAGGQYNRSQLEGLWIAAGGPRGLAHIAAAIALAESGGNAGAINPEGPEHAEGLWQIKGQLVPGDPLNPAVSARNAVAKWRAAGGFSPWVTYTSGAYETYMALGGLLGFASGGIVPPGVKAKFPQRSTAGKIPKGLHFDPYGKIPAVNTNWSGQDAWAAVNAMMSSAGPLAQAAETYSLEETADELALSLAPHGGAFVVTPNAIEKAAGITTPFIEQGNVNLRSGQLGALGATEHGVLNDLTEAWNWSHQVLTAAAEGLAERNKAIADLKAQIAANVKKIKELRKAIERQEAELKKIPTGKKATAADKAHAAKLKQEIADEHGQIHSLEVENRQLGGETTAVGSGGNIGTLLAENTELSNAKASTEGWVTEIGGATGAGGKRQEAKTAITKLEQQMVELGQAPERLKEALLESGSGPESALELAERNLAQSEERLKISREETQINAQALAVFGGPGDIGRGGINAYAAAGARGMLIPASWIPSFDVGGIVPGPKGAPTLALVHGEEEILTPEQRERSGTHFHQHNHIETLTPADPVMLTAIGKAATRGQRLQGYRQAKRLVPGV